MECILILFVALMIIYAIVIFSDEVRVEVINKELKELRHLEAIGKANVHDKDMIDKLERELAVIKYRKEKR